MTRKPTNLFRWSDPAPNRCRYLMAIDQPGRRPYGMLRPSPNTRGRWRAIFNESIPRVISPTMSFLDASIWLEEEVIAWMIKRIP